ncbi:MAG: ABC transporter permease [Salinarimonadaceae bacterium]|nr:MAG: ABC transporter permease [Salinarimonadaceae bacterium]
MTDRPIGEVEILGAPTEEASGSGVSWERFGLPIFVLFALMGSWEGIVRFLEIPGYILPPPTAIIRAFVSGFLTGAFIPDLAVTAFQAVFGFLIGSFIGLSLGVIIVLFPTMERIIYPYVVALQTVPKVALAPLLVVWFGFGMTSKVIVVALVSLFPVLVNVIAGLRSVDQERLDLLGALSATRWQIFWYLRFPNSLPYFFAGLNTAVVLSVIGAIVGEFVGATQGIGFRILQANYNLDIAGAFALFMVLSLLGLTLHGTLKFIERRTVFWTATQTTH